MPIIQNKKTGQAALPRLPFREKQPFYGWIMVGVGVVTQFFQGITSQGYGTYFSPLLSQFGWTKATLSLPRSVTQVENSILGPVEGTLVDRFGPRVVATIGIFVMGMGLILFGLTNSLWMYFVSNIIIALGTGFQGLLIMSVAVNNWFRRQRTIAQSIMLLGFSTAGLVGIPALILTQTTVGWQASAIGSGLVIWIVGLPCAQLLRTKPELYGLVPDGRSAAENDNVSTERRHVRVEYDFTLHEAIRTRSFWLLGLGWAIGNLGMGVAQMHLFLHLEQGAAGLTRTTTGLVWSVASLSNIPSRLIGGFLGDRLPKNIILGCATLLMAISIFVLAVADTATMAFVFAVLYGIGWGIRTPVMNALQADYYGRKSLGKIVGWLQLMSLPFTIAAPVVVGYVADVQETYRSAFIVTSFISLVGAFTILLAITPKNPAAKAISTEKKMS